MRARAFRSWASTGSRGITRRTLDKPVVAAVEGCAVAGGFELVLACDLVVAGVSAYFGLPEVKRGLIAGEGGVVRLPYHVAMKLLLTGDPWYHEVSASVDAKEGAAAFGEKRPPRWRGR